ncbi:MAG TPA: hypothetical protein VGW38_24135 [Chloroflexota bacterium]|nr:hypothetical protein [Chloroflexota bacterium]
MMARTFYIVAILAVVCMSAQPAAVAIAQEEQPTLEPGSGSGDLESGGIGLTPRQLETRNGVTGMSPDLARAQMSDTLSILEAAGLGHDPYQAAAWFLANVYDDHPQTADVAGAILIEARWYRDREQGGEAKAWARLGSRTEAAQHVRGILP